MINRLTGPIGKGGWRGGLILVAVAALAYYAGTARAGISIQTAVAASGEAAITIVTADWSYDVPLDVTWFDGTGGMHSGSRPACLPPGQFDKSVTFGSIEGTRDGVTWRAVVWVDCR